MTKEWGGKVTNDDEPKNNEHNDLYHWVYVVFPAIFVGIVDFIFLRPVYHLLSFLVFGGCISLVVIYELHKRKFGRGLIICAVLSIFTISVAFAALIGPVHLPDTESIGLLQPSHDEDPPNGCPTTLNMFKIVIATSGYGVTDMHGHISAIEMGKEPNACHILGIERSEDGLKLDAELYNADGQKIAVIKDNTYHAIVGDVPHTLREGEI